MKALKPRLAFSCALMWLCLLLPIAHAQDIDVVVSEDQSVAIGQDTFLAEGQQAEAVVTIFGSSLIEGEVSDAVVSISGDLDVSGPVGDAVVLILGNAYVNSRVGGDLVAVMGNVELGPEAQINGDVVVTGGALQRDPNAIIRGNVENVAVGASIDFQWLRPWIDNCLLYARPLALAPGLGWAWGIALGFLAFYLLLAVAFRGGLERCAETLEQQPGRSVLAALLTVLLTPVLIVLLCITVIGIAAVPFVLLALLCAGFFGKAVMLAWIGRRFTRFAPSGPLRHPALAVLVGGVIVLALYLVPVAGFIVYKLLGIIGLGVVVYTIVLAMQSGRPERGKGGEPGARSPSPSPDFPDAAVSPTTAAPSPAFAMASAGSAGHSDAPRFEQASPTTEPGMAYETVAGMGAPSHAGMDPSAGSAGGAGAGSAGGGFGASSPAPAEAATLWPRAGFWIRMAALFLDVLLIGILLALVYDAGKIQLIALAAYGAVMWKLKGTTIGGIICGLQVVRIDGRPIDWPTAIVRALSCFLSLVIAGLGFLWIIFDEGKQAWHDKIAGTAVVRAPKGLSLV